MVLRIKEEKRKAWKLKEAAVCGDLETIKKIALELDKGQGLKDIIACIHDDLGRTALHLAALEGHEEICQYLIDDLGFQPDMKRPSGHISEYAKYWEKTPLMISTMAGRVGLMEYFIKKDVDLNARNENGTTPLHNAVIYDQLEALGVLLACNGVEVDALHPLGTPLLLATAKNDPIMLNMLLDHKADPNMNYTEIMHNQFITPLVVSVLNRSMKCTQLLIEAGADVNKQPVLDMALGSIDLLNYLLQSGADPNIPNKYGELPIEVAVIRGLIEAVVVLFPLTSPIKTVPDWTIEGLFNHIVQSKNFINKDKMAKLKQAIDEVKISLGFTTARYLCFYALQENPRDEHVLSNAILCGKPERILLLYCLFTGQILKKNGEKMPKGQILKKNGEKMPKVLDQKKETNKTTKFDHKKEKKETKEVDPKQQQKECSFNKANIPHKRNIKNLLNKHVVADEI